MCRDAFILDPCLGTVSDSGHSSGTSEEEIEPRKGIGVRDVYRNNICAPSSMGT